PAGGPRFQITVAMHISSPARMAFLPMADFDPGPAPRLPCAVSLPGPLASALAKFKIGATIIAQDAPYGAPLDPIWTNAVRFRHQRPTPRASMDSQPDLLAGRAERQRRLADIDLYPVTCEELSAGRQDAEVLAAVLA